ncbi:ABC transporter type 1, transmembrane domain-containing protein [Lasiosphaeris hirsuta]|uniref:ABC transporter type 1, transmembrane domain-containing protein n=1 Tax=Lasiosphaeris hirsuta TaxID=260670 RepID=A0AA40B965_9PEZI|nr:ABC transporter type 1, transmembrane domain-containing protein [Lasiosphaeris hirsuta]
MDLSEKEKGILDHQLNGLPPTNLSHRSTIFEYATAFDKTVLLISSICAVIGGILNPFIALIYGVLVGAFGDYAVGSVEADEMWSNLSTYSLYYVYLAIAIFVVIYISTVGFYYSGERIIRALRNAYLKAILRQSMAFFDTHGPGEISTRIMSDMNLAREGITSKASVALTAVATFGAAFVITFIIYWKTALVLSPTFVIVVAVGSFGAAHVVRQHERAMTLSSQASSLADEAIASMLLVSAFSIQEHMAAKYSACLTSAGRSDIRSRNATAGMIAWSNAVPPLVYALTFWACSIFLVRGEVSVAALTTTALAVTIGAFAIIRIVPAAQALSSTVASAGLILDEIARRSPQDPFASSGDCPAAVQGDVELRGVSLIYPSRDNRTVLHEVSFAWASGSGKSGVIGLLERFVDLDGKDIQSLNLSWLRGQMVLFGQEARLFDTTIFENIRYGEVGCREKTMQENPNEIRE